MTRLVVFGRSGFCPDMMRWDQWVKRHPIAYVSFDIDADQDARDFVLRWTGHLSVPTLVIAPEEHYGPAEEPAPLPGRGPRGVDRGSMLTEPAIGQVEVFLRRNGIPFGGPDGDPEVTAWEITPMGEQREPLFPRNRDA